MNSEAPLSRVEMIERSFRCLKLGLLGMVPVLGLPMAFMALFQYRRVKRGQGELWNPANRQLVWGARCARLGIYPMLIWGVLVLLSALWESRH